MSEQKTRKKKGLFYDEHPHPVRVARLRAGLSQGELAAKSGLPLMRISNFETRRCTRIFADEAHALGVALGLSWHELVEIANLVRHHSGEEDA